MHTRTAISGPRAFSLDGARTNSRTMLASAPATTSGVNGREPNPIAASQSAGSAAEPIFEAHWDVTASGYETVGLARPCTRRQAGNSIGNTTPHLALGISARSRQLDFVRGRVEGRLLNEMPRSDRLLLVTARTLVRRSDARP